MIVVRNIFRIKFGKTKEATALWKKGIGIVQRIGGHRNMRLLTDVAGPAFYTLIMEAEFDSLAQLESQQQQVMGNAEWRAWYEQLTPLVDSGHREILRIVE